jgi:hypothetical protein
LRNPGLLGKLMEFAGLETEDGYRSTIGEPEGGVPLRWGEGCYVESLVAENERWRKKRARKEGERVEFVAGRSGASSAAGTPKGDGGRKGGRFDKR